MDRSSKKLLIGTLALLGTALIFLWSGPLGSPALIHQVGPTTQAYTNPSESPAHTRPLEHTTEEDVTVYTYTVIQSYPHDLEAYTQGLVFENDELFEGTGLHGRSSLRRVDLESGNILQSHELPVHLFGEGVTINGNKLIQLTWKSNVGFVYNKDSLELIQQFNYSTEGWGITFDGTRLIMSDGTSTLHFLDPDTFEEIGRIDVSDHQGPVLNLNELEYVQGEIYANVWRTDLIARIAPQTGQVIGWIELEGLLSPEDHSEPIDVLNGIAYDAKNDRLFVTGKLWPLVFEIELIPVG